MTYQEAKRILHPSTTADALAEIEYYAGFEGKRAKIEAVDEACLLACDALNQSDDWVLCKDRMPEEKPFNWGVPEHVYSDDLIVTFYDDESGEYRTGPDFTLNGTWFHNINVIAWKKLPEPYIPDQNTK